jgi:hypothetical protein
MTTTNEGGKDYRPWPSIVTAVRKDLAVLVGRNDVPQLLRTTADSLRQVLKYAANSCVDETKYGVKVRTSDHREYWLTADGPVQGTKEEMDGLAKYISREGSTISVEPFEPTPAPEEKEIVSVHKIGDYFFVGCSLDTACKLYCLRNMKERTGFKGIKESVEVLKAKMTACQISYEGYKMDANTGEIVATAKT